MTPEYLRRALKVLAEIDATQARVMERHLFGGLSIEEIAEELGISIRSVKRNRCLAKFWLFYQMKKDGWDPESSQ